MTSHALGFAPEWETARAGDWPHESVVIFYDDAYSRAGALRYSSLGKPPPVGTPEPVRQCWSLEELLDDSASRLAWMETCRAATVVVALSAGEIRPAWQEALENWLSWGAGKVKSLVILSGMPGHDEAARRLAAHARQNGIPCRCDSFAPQTSPWVGRSSEWGINE